jgi:glycosyltransferase involved in cell wall biosynthesis
MLFLCEHETQGMAYQEAMASGVPILAWDPGVWMDENWIHLHPGPVEATSVPYFSPACGERFVDADAFAPTLDRFLERLPRYDPRGYVRERLSLRASAEIYLRAYRAAAEGAPRLASAAAR